jgi:hypothetical protein
MVDCATVSLAVVPSEDGRSWRIQMAWDNGRLDHILCFESKQEAEDWINLKLDREPQPG